MAVATVAAIIGAVAALAGTGAAVNQSRQAARDTRQAKSDMKNANAALQSEAREKEAQEAASRTAMEERKRQLAGVSRNYGRASTILTGPQGLGGESETLG